MKIILLIGIMILSLATVGYGTSLNTAPSVDKIGGEDNTSVDIPNVNISNVVLRVQAGHVNRVTVTVENQDTVNAHTYRICAFLIAGAETSSAIGAGADCADTPQAARKGQSGQAQSAVINISNNINAPNNLSDWDISVQEIG
ncbi:MAG: hypothetical protein K8Q89_07205 [Nitrosarchaeum sp.]|nr:hypothetical protein [Nitrosarchaeum sp.]